MNQTKWDYRFLELAEFVSKWSLDPSTKCGAVIVDKNRRVLSVGYNGLPRGIEDTSERLNNRELKYKLICHCERNAMQFAERNLEGCTLYTWPFMSCSVCASMVIQAGIIRCVAPLNDNPRWKDDFVLTQELFEEAKVELVLLDDKDHIESYYEDHNMETLLADTYWGTDEGYELYDNFAF